MQRRTGGLIVTDQYGHALGDPQIACLSPGSAWLLNLTGYGQWQCPSDGPCIIHPFWAAFPRTMRLVCVSLEPIGVSEPLTVYVPEPSLSLALAVATVFVRLLRWCR